MEQVFIGGDVTQLSPTLTRYFKIVGCLLSSGASWVYSIISAAGKIKSLSVRLDVAPGAGKKYTFTLMLNGAPTALEVEIADAATSGNDMVHEIDVVAEDVVYIQAVPTNSPNVARPAITSIFESATPKESLIIGGTAGTPLDRTTIRYGQVMGQSSGVAAVENDARVVMPTAGTIKDLYVQIDGDIGTAPDAYRFTLRKGPPEGPQASTPLTVTITANDRNGSDLVNTDDVVAGDILTMMFEPLNSPTSSIRAIWCMTFIADIEGESIVLGGRSNNLINNATTYNWVVGTNNKFWASDEDDRYQLGQVCTLKKLHMLLSGAPDAGNSYDFTLRIAGADSNITVNIADTDTTGDSGILEDEVALDEYLDLQCIPTSLPTVRDAYWGFVCYIAPTPPPPPPPPPAEQISFVRCPKCKEVFQLERAGPVGVPGVKDSRRIQCLECGTVFRTKGETWREAHGQLR